MVSPSCPALVIHDDDAFRKSLIATLDQKHFTVTMTPDGAAALDTLQSRRFEVIILGVDMSKQRGLVALNFIRDNRLSVRGGLIILGEPDPELRNYAKVADETLLKPVDPGYVAERALKHCRK
jgi:DNA-binding response OmpR family regulator